MNPKRALVTGAGNRIGAEIARYLGAAGWDVAVHYATSVAGAAAVVDAITSAGGRAVALQADLSDEAQVQTLMPRSITAIGGPITLLVNNAGVLKRDHFVSSTRAEWDENFAVNARAPFVLSQGFAAHNMLAQHKAVQDGAQEDAITPANIINIIDQRVLNPDADYATYTLSKMALWSMTQTLARALAPHVRVNAIGPGTTLRGTHQTAYQFDDRQAQMPLGPGQGVAEILSALGYLIDAGSVTGQMILTDNGQHFRR